MNRQWLYAKQPQGKIGADTFEWTETAIPVPRDGEALVRTRMLSLDPANRAWMMGKTYRDALEPGQVMSGFAIGEVVESKTAGCKAATSSRATGAGRTTPPLPARRLTKRTTEAPLEMLIGPLSVTGLTAYFGLLEVGQPKPGDTVLVSAAAGAVGTMVGQIAKIAGCRVVGTAGGQDKCDWLVRELGFDAAVDYKAGGVLPRAGGGVPQRHRRLFRQYRRAGARRGAVADEPARPHRLLRQRLAIRRREAGARSDGGARPGRDQAAAHGRLHRHGFLRPPRRGRGAAGALGRRGQDQGRGRYRRRPRQGARGADRPVRRQEPRQEGGAG